MIWLMMFGPRLFEGHLQLFTGYENLITLFRKKWRYELLKIIFGIKDFKGKAIRTAFGLL